MKAFFKVKTIEQVLTLTDSFKETKTEKLNINKSLGRILAENIYPDVNIPDFNRSTMDGFAIKASSSFGSSESNPAYLNIKGKVEMGSLPNFSICSGEAAKIATGGALPDGADSVVMLEHTNEIDKTLIEIYKSLAPGCNVIHRGEDAEQNKISVAKGTKIRPQEIGLIAASGRNEIKVFRKPIVSIMSTGNEIIPAYEKPSKGQIRDINSHTLAGLTIEAGGIAKVLSIVPDQFICLKKACTSALETSDIVIISGGSSLGTKDLTIDVLNSIKNVEILVHGIAISPGKPTILANRNEKQIWGLPGHTASAMIVFKVIVQKFLDQISGKSELNQYIPTTTAILNRNIPSSNGRVDYIRVKLNKKNGIIFAEPIIGKSGLINTMTKANGLIKIGMNTEGLYKNDQVSVILI